MLGRGLRRHLLDRVLRGARDVGERGLALLITAGVASCSGGKLTSASDASADARPQQDGGPVVEAPCSCESDSGTVVEAPPYDGGVVVEAPPYDGGPVMEAANQDAAPADAATDGSPVVEAPGFPDASDSG